MEIKERTCIICGKSFVPYTSSQVCCSPACSTLGGNRFERENRRYQAALAETADARTKLENKQQISISDAARLLNVSRPTIYKLIDEGTLSPIRIGARVIRIPREQLQHLIPESKIYSGQVPDKVISKDEALTRYGISETWLYRKPRVLGIRSTIVGGKAYFPKKDLDRLFPPKSCYDRKRWITLEDLERTEGLSEKRILTIAAEHEITREKVGRLLLLSLPEWKKGRELISKLSRYYMTREQATSHYHIGNIRFYDGVHGAGLTPVKSGHYAYYKITDLDKLFKNKEPNIPKEIRRDYVRSCDVTKKYHIAMILSTVRMMDEGDFGTEHECSDEDFQAAMNISKALLQHTARVFRELPRVATQKAVGSGQKTVRRQLFLDALPDEFDRQNFIEISSRLGMPLSTAERNIKKWTDEGLLIRQDLGHYKKRN